MFTKTKVLPKILNLREIKYYAFSAVFISLAVSVPWAFHQFNLLGPQFLPMQIFVLVAGFLFGWKTGLMVGVFSPLLSYSLTHMPVIGILPQVTLELAVYGLVIGILRQRNINVWVSLFSAMILGRAVRILLMFIFASQADSLEFIKISLPGIILQIALVPLAVYFVQKFLEMENGKRI